MSMDNTRHMASAIRYARRGLHTTHPNPNVGCVIVKDGTVVGEGWHHKAGEAHAEINALRRAGADAEGATAYVTLEPCSHHGKTPPCADALIAAGIKKVYVAMQDPNPKVAGEGIQKLRDAGIDVEVGLLESRARTLNPGFIKRMEKGLPYVRIKMAMSVDGRTAMASGESQWITGEAAREDVQYLRARSSAILTGIGTILSDDPSLNVRLQTTHGEVRQPVRVILDSKGQLPANAKTLSLHGKVMVYTANPSAIQAHDNLDIIEAPLKGEHLDLHYVLQSLAQHEINEVHVEAGAVLCGALLNAGLVDEVVVYMAPHLMGNDARGLFELPEIQQMSQRVALKIEDIRAVGDDWRITALPVYKETE